MPQQSIIFRKWSRKGYAIFAGLGRHIVIGVLPVAICGMAMLKAGVATAASQTVTVQASDSEQDEADQILQELQDAIAVSTDNKSKAAPALQHHTEHSNNISHVASLYTGATKHLLYINNGYQATRRD